MNPDITVEQAKAVLREAISGGNGSNWAYAPAVKALLDSHDKLLKAMGIQDVSEHIQSEGERP